MGRLLCLRLTVMTGSRGLFARSFSGGEVARRSRALVLLSLTIARHSGCRARLLRDCGVTGGVFTVAVDSIPGHCCCTVRREKCPLRNGGRAQREGVQDRAA